MVSILCWAEGQLRASAIHTWQTAKPHQPSQVEKNVAPFRMIAVQAGCALLSFVASKPSIGCNISLPSPSPILCPWCAGAKYARPVKFEPGLRLYFLSLPKCSMLQREQCYSYYSREFNGAALGSFRLALNLRMLRRPGRIRAMRRSLRAKYDFYLPP